MKPWGLNPKDSVSDSYTVREESDGRKPASWFQLKGNGVLATIYFFRPDASN